MVAKHSQHNTPVLQQLKFNPDLQKQVMDYTQKFDCDGRSSSGGDIDH
jgi:hypothetical protein